MHAEDRRDSAADPAPQHAALESETLTDIIDELNRSAFRRALDRRHAAPAYRTVIESVNLVATTPS